MIGDSVTNYTVETWDDTYKCVRYHEVVDAIDYEDAEQVVKGLYPQERILGTIGRKILED